MFISFVLFFFFSGRALFRAFPELPPLRSPKGTVLSPCLRGTRGLPRRGCRSRYVFSSGRANPALHLVMLSEVETSFSSRLADTACRVPTVTVVNSNSLRCARPSFATRGSCFRVSLLICGCPFTPLPFRGGLGRGSFPELPSQRSPLFRKEGQLLQACSHLTALHALEPATARHSKSKLFLCSRLTAAFTFNRTLCG